MSAKSRTGPRRNLTFPRIELRELYAFVAVAEELSFSRAAARIHMTQSPISRVVMTLESRIGVALFVRTKRSVRLTDAGSVLLEGATGLLAAADELVDRVVAGGISAPTRYGNEPVLP
jgi:DNA-binding transcriptional LysR family regulator